MFLLNKWWAIAQSNSIRHKPVGLRRLGVDLVLWRDAHGQIVCQSRYCPHRGASLALGRAIDGCVECPYHGFRFAPEGHCTLIPCEGKDAPISPAIRVKTYIVQEAHDLVWLWWGDEQSEYPPIPWFEILSDRPVRWASGTMEWNVPFTRAAENLLIDVHHLPTVHFAKLGKLTKLSSLSLLDPFDASVNGDIIHTWGQLRPNLASSVKDIHISFKHWVYFPSLALFDFEVDSSKLFVIATPIDAENTWAYLRYYIPFSNPWMSRLIARIYVWSDLHLAQTDDYRMVRTSRPRHSSLSVNKFVHADKGIVFWHKLYESHMQAQKSNSFCNFSA